MRKIFFLKRLRTLGGAKNERPEWCKDGGHAFFGMKVQSKSGNFIRSKSSKLYCVNCFEKDNLNPPEVAKESKKTLLIKYRHQLLKLTIKAIELSDKIQGLLSREDKFEDINDVYKKYRPLLYEKKIKENSNKMTKTKNISAIKQLFTSKNNLENAQTNLINAKYAYLLRVKILELYRGNVL